MSREVWKAVKGYEGLYEVSSLGRVKALAKRRRHVSKNKHEEGSYIFGERILSGAVDGQGYIHYRLVKGGKYTLYKAHHLVAEAFLGYSRDQYDRRDPSSLCIDHLNEDKADNRLCNLEVVTLKENVKRYFERRRGL